MVHSQKLLIIAAPSSHSIIIDMGLIATISKGAYSK